MSVPVFAPSLGQSATSVTVLEWLVAPGQAVEAGQPVAVVESDKTTLEIEAPVAGILGPHLAAAEDVVAVGAPLTAILVGGEQPDQEPTAAPTPAAYRADRAAVGARPAPSRPSSAVAVSPRARRRATELGVAVDAVIGTGPDGLVVEADVERAAADSGTWRGRAVRARTRLSPVRRTTARLLSESWAAPHIVQFVEADVTEADLDRRDMAVTWTELAVAATGRCLARFPDLNAAYDDGHIVAFADVGVGFAVDTPDGLLTPVVAAADTLTVREIAAEVRRLAADPSASPGGGSATVSNLGALGIRAGTPVLNPPESVLVFVGAVEDRVVALDGAPAIRRMCTLSVAYDHRVCDGLAAARFTVALRDALADPTTW